MAVSQKDSQEYQALFSPGNEAATPAREMTFEEAMQRLETIVSTLGENSGSLQQTITDYEEGIRLAKECLVRLDKADQRILELQQMLES